jgi:uncharacterized protein (DUF2249 family)
MTATLSNPLIDVRTIAPRDRHPQIFAPCAALGSAAESCCGGGCDCGGGH